MNKNEVYQFECLIRQALIDNESVSLNKSKEVSE